MGCTGLVVVVHELSSLAAQGIFPTQWSNPCLLHWQADSLPLSHKGSLPMGFWRRHVGRNPLTPGMAAGVKAALSYQWLLYPISWKGSFWSVMRSSSWKLHRAPKDSQVWPQVVKSILERAELLRLCPFCSGQGSHLAMPQAFPIRVKKDDLGLLPAHLLQVGRPPQSFLRGLPHFRCPVHDLPLRGPGCCTQEGGTSHHFVELAPPGMVSGLWSHEMFTHKTRSVHQPSTICCTP